jgi:hypothetical protein
MARRISPDPDQLQVLVGTLLGRGRLVSEADGVCLVVALRARHAWLADWTYERLAPFVPPPHRSADRVVIRSAPHPIFADVAAWLGQSGAGGLMRQEAVWVWAIYQRIAACERAGTQVCRCATLRRPPPRRLASAS